VRRRAGVEVIDAGGSRAKVRNPEFYTGMEALIRPA